MQALTHARATAHEILLTAAFRDAGGGIEISRTVRPGGAKTVRTTPPNGRLALEILGLMSLDWRWRSSGRRAGEKAGYDPGVIERLAKRVSRARAEYEQYEPGSPGESR
ncbi:hypothetical protein GCM10017600_68990 [Streptosporangium carneum]|uniref:Uncharacterized protein n=1 Tax=Streptosporangium carneum TaxID=47481 RepID=A0A9W6I8B7_9ACTN|nr:hypothetical protein GCM10017600_68990 [Streptosporangium carneum]